MAHDPACRQAPSYLPDYNPIAYLWKKTKKQATHNQYFKDFVLLTGSVEEEFSVPASGCVTMPPNGGLLERRTPC